MHREMGNTTRKKHTKSGYWLMPLLILLLTEKPMLKLRLMLNMVLTMLKSKRARNSNPIKC